MPFIAIPDVCQAEVRMVLDNQNIENVFHFRIAGGVTQPSMQVLADELVQWWITYYKPISVQGLRLREVYVTDETSQAGSTATAVAPANTIGNIVDESMSNNTAYVVTLRTAQRGRSYRGRIYFTGIPQTSVTGNYVTPAHRNLSVAAANGLLDATQFGDAQLVIASRRSGGVNRPVGVSTTVIAAVALDDVVDSQRRRLPGRGK